MRQSDKVKYLVFRGKVLPIVHSDIDNLWRSIDGTIMALTDDSASVDPVNRCGVGIFSLSEDHPLTAACTPHDFAYSSPAYQLFHTRKEADAMLEQLTSQINGWSFLAKPFKWLSRIFGSSKWENEATNN